MSLFRALTSPITSVFRSLNTGFDMATNIRRAKDLPLVHTGSVLGMAAGGTIGAISEDMDPMTGAMIGGAVGTAALPALGMTAGLGAAAGEGVIRNLDTIGDAMIGTAKGAAGIAAGGVRGVQIPGHTTASKILSPVQRNLSAYQRFADNFVSYDPTRYRVNQKTGRLIKDRPLKLTPLGKGVIGAGAIAGGIGGSAAAYETSRMGERDPYITRATPRIPQPQQQAPAFMNNAGATGDLVFAMNANRRG